jgi:hypothetical protein
MRDRSRDNLNVWSVAASSVTRRPARHLSASSAAPSFATPNLLHLEGARSPPVAAAPDNLRNPNIDPWHRRRRPALIRLPVRRRRPRHGLHHRHRPSSPTWTPRRCEEGGAPVGWATPGHALMALCECTVDFSIILHIWKKMNMMNVQT